MSTLCGLALVAACGAGGPTTPPPASPVSAQHGDPAPGAPGLVTVTPSAPAYRLGEVIVATVANGRGDTIYTADGRTDCSIIMLERWDGQRFVPIPACLAGRTDRPVTIGPGLGRTVRIDPGSGHFGGTRLGAGTYRMALDYGLDPGRDAARPFVAHSPTFEIRA